DVSLRVGPHIIVLRAWFCPDLAENLLSVGEFDRAGHDLRFGSGKLRIFIDREYTIGDLLDNNLYRVNIPAEHFALNSATTTPQLPLNRAATTPQSTAPPRTTPKLRFNSTLHLWHLRLGHLNYRAVGNLLGLSVPKNIPPCHGCMLGKMKSFSHPPTKR